MYKRQIHIFVWNSKGELFLQFRSRLKKNHPQTWDSSCSGHLSTGQDYYEAAIRELEEEIGLDETQTKAIRPVFKVKSCPETEQEHVWLYEMVHDGPFQLQAEEIEDGRFFSQNDIQKMISENPVQFAPSFVYIWNLYLRQQKS